MHLLLIKIQELLARSGKERVDIDDKIIEEFGEACKQAFKKQFTEEREENFTIRMSSIGKPLCQLQMEKQNTSSESPPYNFKMRVLFGDLIEASAIAIMKAAGIKFLSEFFLYFSFQKKMLRLKIKFMILKVHHLGLMIINFLKDSIM